MPNEPTPAKWAEVMVSLADSLIKDVLRTSTTEENIALAEKALSLANSKSPLALVTKARICRAKGEHKGTLEACNEALGCDSTLTEASIQKAFAQVFLGNPKDAIVTAVDLGPRGADSDNLNWLLGRAYFSLATAPAPDTPSEAVAKHYDHAIHWLQKSVDESPGRWYVTAHLIGAYACAGRLGEPEAKAALKEYRQNFEAWSLDPVIRNWAGHQRFQGDTHHDFRAAICALLKGLEKAQAEGFP